MQTTLTEMRRETKNVARALGRGEAVTLTEHGRPIGLIRPDAMRQTVSAAELRAATITDQAIVEAIAEARE